MLIRDRRDARSSRLRRSTAARRRRARGRLATRARRGRDAGLHAGRHAGRREGARRRPSSASSARRSCSPTPITCSLRPGDERRRGSSAGCTASWLGRPDPHRLRRLPGLLAGATAHDRRGGRPLPLAPRRRAPRACTPERAIAIQEALGADIAMALDECPPRPSRRATRRARAAATRTLRWARALPRGAHAAAPARRCFGIVQGGIVRRPAPRSAPRRPRAIGFDGYALGGLAVGEAARGMRRARRATVGAELPADRPRYLMGVGRPRGPRRGGRRGRRPVRLRAADAQRAATASSSPRDGLLTIRNARSPRRRRDRSTPTAPAPPAGASRGPTCATSPGARDARPAPRTLHNLRFYLGLMRRMRAAIAGGTFAAFRSAFLARLGEARAEEEA